MLKPYFQLDVKTQNIILELFKKAMDLQLGNINFQYYATKDSPNDVNFYITEFNSYWELVVKQQKRDRNNIYWNLTDIYRIEGDHIKYQSSEYDLS